MGLKHEVMLERTMEPLCAPSYRRSRLNFSCHYPCYSEEMDDLNAQQRQAVEAGDGPMVIIAGPGTGKTKTLVARLKYLVASGQTPAERILALTFTRKACEEMQARARLPGVKIATFHSLCHEILGDELVFATEAQRLLAIRGLKKPTAWKGLGAREIGLRISRAKNMRTEADAATRACVAAYDAELQRQQLMDFDDLLVRTVELLQHDAATRQVMQRRFAHILVDEFQDTNALQYELLMLLRGNDNVCVIGDPQQSIYGFRGADGGIFDRFVHDFPRALHVTLTTNYRSVPEVVRLSNALSAGALRAHRSDTGTVRAVQTLNEYSEANWILNAIQRRLGGSDLLHAISDDDRAGHRSLADFAIIYRSRSAARAVQRVIAESGLPYQIVGDGSPYDDPQVQLLIGLLCASVDGEGVVPGVSSAQQAALVATIDPGKPPADNAQALVAATGIEPSQNVQHLIGSLVQYKTMEEAAAHFALLSKQDFYDPRAEAITLLTIHAAKGLEFGSVFLVGIEEGLLPHDVDNLEEEQRLLYVAVTRARDSLTMLYTHVRGGKPRATSRFIAGLAPTVLTWDVDDNVATDQRRLAKRHAKRAQTSLF